jgi:short-chain fatty acids transporter
MISRLGLAFSRAFERTAPDPLVIAILLTLLTAALAMFWGRFPAGDTSLEDRAAFLLDSWRDSRTGIWKLLEFSMQMCLILVTGHALAVTRPVKSLIRSVAQQAKGTASASALVGFLACAFALVNWGLGLIVGALLAREVGRSLHQRGIRAHYPLIVAAGYTGLMVWHGGLSGSAPLNMTSATQATSILGQDLLARLGLSEIGLGLNHTIFSPMNLFVSLGLLLIVPACLAMLAPKHAEDLRPCDEALALSDYDSIIDVKQPIKTVPDFLERTPAVAWMLAAILTLGLARFVCLSGVQTIGLNDVNVAMLALGLILHGSTRSYMAAAEQGARGCAGIIIQFPLYAGIMAMMQASGLVELIAQSFTAHSNEHTLPLFTFASAGLINLFIPSGGGQWAIQGPIAMEAGLQIGVPAGKMVMSIAYGDQLTNMLQPFWALPLLAITGAKARDIVGYTAVVMVIGAAWVVLGLLLF